MTMEEAQKRKTVYERGYAFVMIELSDGEQSILTTKDNYDSAQSFIDEQRASQRKKGHECRMWIE